MIIHVRSEATDGLQRRYMKCVGVTVEERTCEVWDDQSFVK
jgi:hypothetical protein